MDNRNGTEFLACSPVRSNLKDSKPRNLLKIGDSNSKSILVAWYESKFLEIQKGSSKKNEME